jgi:hypothetical protein
MKIIPPIAYQVESTESGGYQLYRLSLDKDLKVTSKEKVESPDSWDMIISYLELDLSRHFA